MKFYICKWYTTSSSLAIGAFYNREKAEKLIDVPEDLKTIWDSKVDEGTIVRYKLWIYDHKDNNGSVTCTAIFHKEEVIKPTRVVNG
jgi:hypothetical protein